MKLMKILSLAVGILLIVAGLYCLFSPTLTYLAIAVIIGISMLVDGIAQISAWAEYRKAGVSDGWALAGAILSLVLGVVLLGSSWMQLAVDLFIAVLIAVWLIVRGAVSIVRAFRVRRFHKDWETVVVGRHWWVSLLLGVFVTVFGVLALLNPQVLMVAIGIFIGLAVIFVGAGLIVTAVSSKNG